MSSRGVDVAIVGGGINGLAVAWHLRRAGVLSIAVVERVGIGSGATSIQPGGLRQQWASRVNCLLSRESFEFYMGLDDRLATSVDAGFRSCGYLFVAESEQALAGLAENVRLQNEVGIPSRIVSPTEAGELVPGLDSSAIVGASYCAQDGYFDRPQAVVAAFFEACLREGVSFVAGNVEAVERSGSGWRLRLGGPADGVACSAVVIAAGYDSPALVAPLGVDLPIRREPRYLFYSDPIKERLVEPLVVAPERHFAAKHLADGSVLASDLSAGNKTGEDRHVWLARIKTAICDLLPILEYVSFPVLVEGFYDLTPDGKAIVGPVDGLDGLWVAAGSSGRGFMVAPAVGRLLALAIACDSFDEILPELAPDRFGLAALTPELQIV